MQVILLETLNKLGELGDTVQVKPGYARNFLIPSGKAVLATSDNRSEFESRRADLERVESEVRAAAQARADALEGMVINIECRVGDEGRLFGSVGTADVVAAIAERGVEVSRPEIRLPEETLRHTGEYLVSVHLRGGVDATLTVVLEPRES